MSLALTNGFCVTLGATSIEEDVSKSTRYTFEVRILLEAHRLKKRFNRTRRERTNWTQYLPSIFLKSQTVDKCLSLRGGAYPAKE